MNPDPIRNAEPPAEGVRLPGWYFERRPRRWPPVIWTALAALSAWLAWTSFRDGMIPEAVIAVLVAVALAWMVPPPRLTTAHPRLVDVSRGRGVLLPMRAKSLRFVLVGSLFIVLVIYAGVRGLLDGELVPGLLASALGVLAASAMVNELRMQRRGPRGVIVTPVAVELQDRHPAEVLSWEQIQGVHAWHTTFRVRRAALPIRSRPATLNRLSFTLADGEVDVDVDELRCDPAAVFRFLDTYARQPALRGELGSQAALRRWSTLAASVSSRPSPAIADGAHFKMWQPKLEQEDV